MKRLSAVLICYNEEKKIKKAIESLDIADEIIVVDSFSTDNTVAVASQFEKVRLYQHKWQGYKDQKQLAISYATCEWVISLDSDERLSDDLKQEIVDIIKNPDAEGYRIPRLLWYINRWLFYTSYPSKVVRLFKRSKGKMMGESVHENIAIDGKVGELNSDIYHLSFDNISSHLQTIDRYSDLAAIDLGKKNIKVPLLSVLLRFFYTFLKMYILKKGFLDKIPGFIYSVLSAYSNFCKYQKVNKVR